MCSGPTSAADSLVAASWATQKWLSARFASRPLRARGRRLGPAMRSAWSKSQGCRSGCWSQSLPWALSCSAARRTRISHHKWEQHPHPPAQNPRALCPQMAARRGGLCLALCDATGTRRSPGRDPPTLPLKHRTRVYRSEESGVLHQEGASKRTRGRRPLISTLEMSRATCAAKGTSLDYSVFGRHGA